MSGIDVPVLASWLEAALFAAGGLLNLVTPTFLRRVFEEYDVPPLFYRGVGVLELVLALEFVAPVLMVWVVFVAGAVLLHAGVILLDRRHYPLAAVVMGMLVLLFASAARIPQEHNTLTKSVYFCAGSEGGADWNGPAYDSWNIGVQATRCSLACCLVEKASVPGARIRRQIA